MQPNTRFGLTTTYDLYNKLKYDAKLLLRERSESEEEQRLEEYEAFNFFVTAWHLHHDWLHSRTISKPLHSCEKIRLANSTVREVRHAMRDIANGSKHFSLRDAPKTSVGAREISDWTSYFFGPQYPIETKSHHFLMYELVYIILEYFDWIFDDSAPNSVPESIVEKLQLARELYLFRQNPT